MDQLKVLAQRLQIFKARLKKKADWVEAILSREPYESAKLEGIAREHFQKRAVPTKRKLPPMHRLYTKEFNGVDRIDQRIPHYDVEVKNMHWESRYLQLLCW